MNHKLFTAMIVPLLGLVGCADHPFLRTDPPVTRDGVTVSLVGQKCGREAWYENYDVLNLGMVVQVTNASATPVEIVPANMRLLARGNSTPPEREDAPVEVAPNSTSDVHVDFQRWGNAKCNQQMRLSLDHALEISGHDVAVRPLSFVPDRSDV